MASLSAQRAGETESSQKAAEMHSVSLAHCVRHAVPAESQVKRPQESLVALGQVPAPSQKAALVRTPLEQLAALHWVVGKVHALREDEQAPWQTPEPAQAARVPRGEPMT